MPGLNEQLVDLMYAYVEGRRFAGGWLGFKVGRQYVTDVLGWWAFDGGEASVTTPYFLKAEVYGGLEERGGMPLSTPRFEAEGVWRGNRSGYDPSLYPQFQPARLAPAYAVALESTGVTWIHGRLTYRRVYEHRQLERHRSSRSGLLPPAVYTGSRVSSERLGLRDRRQLRKHRGSQGGLRLRLLPRRRDVDLRVARRLPREPGHRERRLRLLSYRRSTATASGTSSPASR